MNKLYQRINWQNYPSDSTPLNESNLNKMDAAVDGIDDRVVTLDVTKLPVATANTMVKDVTFNETTGVFTITKLNGTKVTVNTALEKIATNFRFDHSTQKLILTLIDGTTQEVDLSALLTQYEFIDSDTIQFTIDSSGKVKASVKNGSITGDMLEPNYLANVTLQANNAKTSAENAKTSEELAYQYAEEARESASQAQVNDAANITYDNSISGLEATNVKDALDEVAQGSDSALKDGDGNVITSTYATKTETNNRLEILELLALAETRGWKEASVSTATLLFGGTKGKYVAVIPTSDCAGEEYYFLKTNNGAIYYGKMHETIIMNYPKLIHGADVGLVGGEGVNNTIGQRTFNLDTQQGSTNMGWGTSGAGGVGIVCSQNKELKAWYIRVSDTTISDLKANKSSVLSTIADCTASTKNTDIAGASALAELKDSSIKYKRVEFTVDMQTAYSGTLGYKEQVNIEQYLPSGQVVGMAVNTCKQVYDGNRLGIVSLFAKKTIMVNTGFTGEAFIDLTFLYI